MAGDKATAVLQKKGDSQAPVQEERSSGGLSDFASKVWGRTRELGREAVDAAKPVVNDVVDAARPVVKDVTEAGKKGVQEIKKKDQEYGVSADVKAAARETADEYKRNPRKALTDAARVAAGDPTVLIEKGAKVVDRQVERNGNADTRKHYKEGKQVAEQVAPIGRLATGGLASGGVGGLTDIAADGVKKKAIDSVVKDPEGSADAAAGAGKKALSWLSGLKDKVVGGEKTTERPAEGVGEVRRGDGKKATPANGAAEEMRKNPKW